ncbi:MAG: amidohydrolase [Kordiimonadaceae bacterium]|nr:amidohydrolase [Kordiimonadaceae bacterium]MBO6567979.1 amidohydrolase [Kordiimonadaceae bacterium]MBO6964291.1 amidohydrolase [Kordiimonadaceae bacterium]
MTISTALWALTQSSFAQETLQNASDDAEPLVVADLIIWGGTIYTAEDSGPTAEAVAVQNGRIIFVGARSGAEGYLTPQTQIVDLEGASLYPGFTDAHAHLSGIGARELSLNLEGVASLKALQQSLSDYAAANPEQTVVVGRGWIETHWPEERFPSRWDLDDVVSDRPVILFRADGHAAVVNTAALTAASITGETPDPFGGAVQKNALNEPNGMLIDTAMGLVRGLIPAPTEADVAEQLSVGGRVYAEYGWTGLHNMSVSWQEVDLLESLSDRGDFSIRVYNSVNPEHANDLFEGGWRANENRRIITRAIKLYMDGALGSRGAALLEPYADANSTGLILSKAEEVLPIMETALRAGVQINMHAIGDLGNRQLLDWFEQSFNTVPAEERAVATPRWRDEHTQIVHPDDIPRYAQLGVIPSMQPSHAIGDLHFATDRLGDERLDGAYAWQSFLDTGVIIAGGSDAPVERGDPLIEFYAATARRDLNGYQGENWRPEEALTRAEALKMFTLWPAIASFAEDEIGTIAVGKKADLTAFNIDLMTAPEADIPKGRAVLTVVDGEIVYQAP